MTDGDLRAHVAPRPLAEFCDELRQLRRNAPGLSLKKLSRRSQMKLSDSQLSVIEQAKIKKLPDLDVVLEFVQACAERAERPDGKRPIEFTRKYWEQKYNRTQQLLDAEQVAQESTFRAEYRGLVLAVEPLTTEIERLAGSAGNFEEWVKQEGKRLRGLWDLAGQASDPGPDVDIQKSMIAGRARPDPRTREDYNRQVDHYLNVARKVLETRHVLRFETHAPSMVALLVRNPTERNIANVRTEFCIPGPALGITESWRDNLPRYLPKMPRPPEPPGATCGSPFESILLKSTGSRKADGSALNMAPRFVTAPLLSRDDRKSWTAHSLEGGGVRVTFRDDFDLRPGESHPLPPVPVLVDLPVGTVLRGHWASTSSNLDGRCSGEFCLTVMEGTLVSEDPYAIDLEQAPIVHDSSPVFSFSVEKSRRGECSGSGPRQEPSSGHITEEGHDSNS